MGYRERILSYAPPWFQGPNLTTLLQAIGSEWDARAEQVLRGRMQAIPYAGGDGSAQRVGAARLADGRLIECEPFVLPVHATDRGIPLYPTEGLLSQRIRLSQWRQLHQQRGTHRGELLHVRPYFADTVARGFTYPVMRIVHQSGSGHAVWHTMSSAGVYSVYRPASPNFNYDGRTSLWSRWWAFVEMQGTGFTPPYTYGDGDTYGDGILYGEGGTLPFTAARQADVVSMFADWKSAHSWLGGVVLVWGGSIDITAAPVQDATGWWSLPNGKWGNVVDPVTHIGTRPPSFEWILDTPAP